MKKLLVVDDEEAILELVSAILKSEGYEVVTANSGLEALEIMEHESVDLVLLDVMMPEMDGWAVVKEMKKRPELKKLPVAMLTVKKMSPQYFYSDDVEGIVDYINKPFSKDELIDRVRTLLEEVDRIESLKEDVKSSTPEFMKHYEEISKTERLYENLMKSLEFSLTRLDNNSQDYEIVKDAIDYGKVLLERIREKKENYEKLIKEIK
jgi:CheY-like chemotaxis protein